MMKYSTYEIDTHVTLIRMEIVNHVLRVLVDDIRWFCECCVYEYLWGEIGNQYLD